MTEKRDHTDPPAGLLRRTLQETPAGTEARACADAELLAAYFERALDPGETARWEAHFASCAGCREKLAVLGTAEVDAAARSLPGRRRGAGWVWSWRWLAPVGAAALAVAVWISLRPEPPQVVVAPVLTEQQDARVAPTPESRDTLAPKKDQAVEDKLAARDAAAPLSAPMTLEQQANSRRRDSRTLKSPEAAPAGEPAAPAPPAGAPAEKREEAAKEFRVAQQQAEVAGVAPAQAEGMRAKEPGKALAAAETDRQAVEPLRDSAPPIGAAPTAGLTVTGRRSRAMMGLRLQPQEVFVVSSPDGGVQWKVKPLGKLEVSRDAGRTWQQVALPAGERRVAPLEFLAGAAPSAEVCWLVGAAGVVLRTANAEKWEQTSAPADADLIAVEARDALRATVTTAEGQRFETRDSGRTWRRLE